MTKNLFCVALLAMTMTVGCGGDALPTGGSADMSPPTGNPDLSSAPSDPTAACTAAGGECEAVYPGSCPHGHSIGPDACGGGVGSFCCVPDAPPTCKPLTGSDGSANPASVYCAELGYATVDSMCAFPDGTSCDAWAFFRGQCGQTHSFCALHGGQVTNVQTPTSTYASCAVANGKTCAEQDFARTCVCQ